MTIQEGLAKGLGYLVGFGSLMLYTPIAIRLCRQKHADGLVMSTWWLKVASYLLSDVYYIRKGYDLSTYAETIIITVEAFVVLSLAAVYQHKARERSFWICIGTLLAGACYGLTIAPEGLVATGQLVSAIVNVVALFPQFWYNWSNRTKGDYSPFTLLLAVGGCSVRLFTTVTLNQSDPILMVTFVVAALANAALLVQILYYGMAAEGLTLWQVLVSDVVTTTRTMHAPHNDQEGFDGGVIDRQIYNSNSNYNNSINNSDDNNNDNYDIEKQENDDCYPLSSIVKRASQSRSSLGL